MVWKRWEWATDSAGPGKWRGGLGVHNEWEADSDPEPVFLHYAADPYDYIAAPSIDGGKLPPPNIKELYFANGEKVDNEQVRKTKSFVLHSGDKVVDFVQGGCGVGNPFEREIQDVVTDVRDEFVSIESAAKDYGVVIDPKTFKADMESTQKLRNI
jgi:N-methylhydantoinase B